MGNSFLLEDQQLIETIEESHQVLVDAKKQVGLKECQKQMKDLVGWVCIDQTNIDYPIVQGEDDLQYCYHSADGKPLISGSIYLSCRNKGDFSDPYNIIYGHNMSQDAMFGELKNYLDLDFYSKHQTGTLQTFDKEYDLNVVAALETSAYDPVIYQFHKPTKEKMIKRIRSLNKHQECNVDETAQLFMCSTCKDYETDARIVVIYQMEEKDGTIEKDNLR